MQRYSICAGYPNYLSGLKTLHSTGFHLSYSNDNILTGFVRVLCTSLLLIDPPAAFNAIKFEILPHKTKRLSIFKKQVTKRFKLCLSLNDCF